MLSSESVGHIKKLVERENWHYALAFVPNLIATNRTLQTRIAELEAIPLMQTVLEQKKQIERQHQAFAQIRDALRTVESDVEEE